MRARAGLTRLVVCAALLVATAALSGPDGSSASAEEGRVFAPRPVPAGVYGISAPTATRQNTTITARDGVRLYIEWWLPTATDRKAPPKHLPVIAHLSPYLSRGAPGEVDTMKMVVPLGYAYATFHVRGTGLSGGCQEQFSSNEIDDAARAIEWLGQAPFSNGRIGTTGLSYPGITQVGVAGRGDRQKVKYLKAIVAGGVATSQYDYNFFDGVPFTGQALAHTASYNLLTSMRSQGTPDAPAERVGCMPDMFLGSADSSGSMTPFWADRDLRVGAPRTTAAVLIYHGHRDEIDREIALAGYVDRLPKRTPRHVLIGTWGHAFPDTPTAPGARADWDAIKLAWFDRWVKGDKGAGVERWPTVQVQDSTEQWRAERSWPSTAGPRRQLALSTGGVLGAAAPSGATSFVEGASTEDPGSRGPVGHFTGRLFWRTPALKGPLHVTGQPVLDLWVQLDRDDAHLAARLSAYDAGGRPVRHATAMGFRSLQHLDPLVNGRFAQKEAKPAPVGRPFQVALRFDPASFVVPAGGRLELTLSGSLAPNSLSPSQPSGKMTLVTVLTDCTHPSVLRFQGVPRVPDVLNVQDLDEELPLTGERVEPRSSDGGGLASRPVCGQLPR